MNTKVKQWFKDNSPLKSGTYYLKTLEGLEGDVCLRTFALRVTKKDVNCKEVVRDFLNKGLYVHGDLHWCGAGGYRVMFEERKYPSFFLPCDCDDHWYKAEKRPNISSIELFESEDIEKIFKKYIPYFVYSEECRDSPVDYAQKYKKYPACELLVKNGFPELATNKTILKLSKKNKKRLIQYLNENRDYLKNHYVNGSVILSAMKRNVSIEGYYFENAIDQYEKDFKLSNLVRTRKQCVEVYKYLNSAKQVQKIGLSGYIDYLNMAQMLGFDMTAKNVLFPLDCAKAHDSLARQYNKNKFKLEDKKFKKISEVFKTYNFQIKDLKLVFPSSNADFIEWGKKLGICVGSAGYFEKMLRGNCVIAMVYQNDEPLECCELTKCLTNKHLKINQLRGKYNQSSNRHGEARKLVNKFIKNYINTQQFGLCI